MVNPPPVMVATLGMWDTMLLMVLALVVFGPRRLPQIGRQIGKLMYEFRKASNDFKFQMEEELRQAEEADRRKKEEEERQRALASAPPPPQIEQTAAQPVEPPLVPSQPEPSASATVESPYAGETTYPDLAAEGRSADETVAPAESSESPSPEAAAEVSAEVSAAAPAAEIGETMPAAGAITDSSADQPAFPSDVANDPRIQPPSTGQTVAAERPGKQTQPDAVVEDAGKPQENVTSEAERSEPAAHHG
jgi:sec-independent protein translocase protein TatB